MKQQVGNLSVTYNNDRFINDVLIGGEYNFLGYYPTVIDIGANIGTFSLSMLDRADKVYAIEPVKENIACLIETIKDNDIKKIFPYEIAISYGSWVQKMEQDRDPGMGGWRLSESGTYPVDCRTLKDFMDSQQIEYADLVKMDVEGLEEKIISTPLFPKDRIGTIIGEIHTGADIKELLEWQGFKYIAIPDSNHFIARKK